MRNSGINFDIVIFNIFIEIYIKVGRINDVYKFLRMMLDVGCLLNYVIDMILDFFGKEMEKFKF